MHGHMNVQLLIIICTHRLFIQTVIYFLNYEGWNFNSGNYLFTTDTK